MSGIYIPGVELPPIDEYLHLRIDGNGYVSAQISAVECVCFLADTDRKAIEIPPHGRLIDADALSENMRSEALGHTIIGDLNRHRLGYGEVILRLKDAHTIIPADPEDMKGENT